MIYKLQNGRTIPLGGDYLEYLQSIPEIYGGSIQPSIKVEALPKKFNGSQKAARTYAEGYQKGAKPVTKAMDNAGQKIFNTTKNVAMFIPGPTGAITWLGQMGADTANGEYSKVAKDLGAAILIGAGLKGAQVGAKAAGRALAGKGVNIPWLDAYDYSALRNEYLNRNSRKINYNGPLRYAIKHDLPTNGNFGVTEYKAIDALSGKEIGKLGTTQDLEHLGNKTFARTKSPQYVDNINGSDGNKGVSRTLYNAALNDRPIGLISGESLREPIKTEAVWKHFPYKVIRYNGMRPEGKTGRIVDLRKSETFVPILDESALKIKPLLSKSISPQEAATTYHFDGKMPLSKPISEAERLGIPKALRSNSKALEDPYYWGYQQWNSRYNAAVNSGNIQEAQRLRDLHFKIKAPDTKIIDENGNPLHTYHGFLPSRRGVFTKFKGVNFDVEHTVKEGSKTNHWKLSIPNKHRMTSYHTPNYNHALTAYASGNPDSVYDDYLYIKNPFTWNEENLHNVLLNSGHTSEKIPFREPGYFRKTAARDSNGNLLTDENGSIIFKDSDIWIPEKSGFRYPQISDWADFRGNSKTELMKLGYDGLYIPQYYDSYGAFVSPSQFKSAEPITRTDSGEIIPIVKRDNFHNLDRRYKQGGKI